MPVPYPNFASATTSIPLSQLDNNFATTITLGNVAIQLGNVVTSLGNVTLTNTTISGLSGGSANGVVYINSSNVAVASPTVLAFDGTNLGLGVTPSAWSSSSKAFQFGANGTAILENFNGLTNTFGFNTYRSVSSGYVYTTTGNAAALFGTSYTGGFGWSIAPSGFAGNAITFTQAMTLDTSGNLSNTGNISSGIYIKAATYLWAAGTGAAGGVYLGAGSANGCISQASQGTGTVTTYIGNAQITTVSDSRLKENVVDTTIKAVDTLNKLRVVDHTWNDPSDQCKNNRNSRGTWVGLIAQEAQPIIPWLVNKPTEDVDKDGNPQYWHMDYGYSVPLLIKAIQELSAQVTTLQTQVTALQAKVGV